MRVDLDGAGELQEVVVEACHHALADLRLEQAHQRKAGEEQSDGDRDRRGGEKPEPQRTLSHGEGVLTM